MIWGKKMAVSELMKLILEERSFYLKTGGGVTLSGGEVMLQWQFAERLLSRLLDHALSGWRRSNPKSYVGVNIGGVINGIVTFLPRILKHGEEGHIISTSSTGGLFAVTGAGIYCATKYAVAGIMESFASDLAGTNVHASVYFPGPVKTTLPLTSVETRPAHLKNEDEPQMPAGQPSFDMSAFMDPVEVGERILNAIKRNDLIIMTHPEFRDGIKARNEALLRAITDEEPDPKRLEVLRNFGALLYNPIYDKQTTPPPLALTAYGPLNPPGD